MMILLWLIAIHSFIIGVMMISGTLDVFKFFGFPYHGGFFTIQAGVFHLVLAMGYLMTAYNLNKQSLLIWFCISAKLMAAVFLLLYFAVFEPIWMILISGAVDLLMGLLLLQAYNRFKRSSYASEK